MIGKTYYHSRLRRKFRVIDISFDGDVITAGRRRVEYHSGRFDGKRFSSTEWMAMQPFLREI